MLLLLLLLVLFPIFPISSIDSGGREHLCLGNMPAAGAERRRDELRQLVHWQVDVRHLRYLDAHEVGMEAPLHGQVTNHHQASLLKDTGTRER